MRHQVKGRKLGRTTPHRKATLQALSVALIKEKRIKTTLPKAKELRRFVEPIITKAKSDTTHNRRQVFSSLRDKHAVTELFENVAQEVGDRPGGYTRVLKLGTRLGDAAEMAVIELVDYNDTKPEKKEAKKKRTRRAGKSNKPTDGDESSVKESTEKKKSKQKAPKASAPEAQAEETVAEEAESAIVDDQKEKEEETAEVKTASVAKETEDDESDSDTKAETDAAESNSEAKDEESDEKK